MKNTVNSEYDFFISFSNKDADVVSEIVNVIENVYKAKCWFQTKDSKAEFVDAIMEGIENANAFLVFVIPDSANSYFVLDEVYHAIEWKQEHPDYKILPIVISANMDLSSPEYKRIRFFLGRLNMIFLNKASSTDALVLKIFEQTGFKIINDELRESLYHSSESEAKRLEAQNEIMNSFSKEFFEDVVKPEARILDVGCAGGDSIILRLQGHRYLSLLGVDLDQEQIYKANEQYGSDKNSFMCCDILSEDFDSLLVDYLEEKEALGFDLIHISAVLLHLVNPVKLLHTLRRYLKKNGYLFIQDEDDGANVVYPESRFFDLAFSIWADSKESGDRHCARKIPSYLAEAGYSKVRLAKCGVASAGLSPEYQSALWDIYFNYHLWLAVDEDMFYHLSATKKLLKEYQSIYDEYKKQYDDGKIFIQLGFFFYIAQK